MRGLITKHTSNSIGLAFSDSQDVSYCAKPKVWIRALELRSRWSLLGAMLLLCQQYAAHNLLKMVVGALQVNSHAFWRTK